MINKMRTTCMGVDDMKFVMRDSPTFNHSQQTWLQSNNFHFVIQSLPFDLIKLELINYKQKMRGKIKIRKILFYFYLMRKRIVC